MNTDFLIIGGGVIGISVARELKKRFKDSSVTVIEKEIDSTQHASGRNSGVLHAGFYYTADSLKAQFTRDGNKQLTEYCEQKNLPINRCGKLIVAKNEQELAGLDELLARGQKNGVELQSISASEAVSIEPRVLTHERALFSPTTSSVDPIAVVDSMVKDAVAEGVVIQHNTAYLAHENDIVVTSNGNIHAGYVVNASGLYADRIAKNFGFSENYRILPFKGLYLYSSEPPGSLRTNIYPVPNLGNPFLGVHFTVTVEGKVKIGPTAIPAFWREQYQGFDKFQISEFTEILARQTSLCLNSKFDFFSLAIEEFKKYSRTHLVKLSSLLVKDIEVKNYTKWGKPGIRAQLLDIKNKKLEMDFVVEGDNKSMHVLNAVSPAFTCSMPFSSYVCDLIDKKLAEH